LIRPFPIATVILLLVSVLSGCPSHSEPATSDQGKPAMSIQTPQERYLAYLASRAPGVPAGGVLEVPQAALGDFHCFRVADAVGPQGFPAAASVKAVAAADHWDGWPVLFAAAQDPTALQRTVAFLLGGYIPLAPGDSETAEARALLTPPALEQPTAAGWRFDAWFAGPPLVEEPVRITVELPSSGHGRVETKNWRELAQPDPVDRLLAEYLDVDPVGKTIVVRQLADLADERSVPLLCGALAQSYDRLRYEAAVALKRVRSTQAVGCLAQSLPKEAVSDVRLALVQALAAIGGPAARDALTQAASTDADATVRSMARAALEQ